MMEKTMYNYDTCPEHVKDSLYRYIEHGIKPGSFLQAVLSNNLMESFGMADSTNRRELFDICNWIYNYAPCSCHGSPEIVLEYLAQTQHTIKERKAQL